MPRVSHLLIRFSLGPTRADIEFHDGGCHVLVQVACGNAAHVA
jgi:hypothetical protein